MANKIPMLTIKEVAKTLRVSDTTIRRWIEEGKIKALKFGHQWRFRTSDISQWLERGDLETSKSREYILDVVIEPDEDVYHVYCPVLDGCHSSGDTEAEAFRNIQEAVRLHLDVMIEDGKAIPGIGIVDSLNQLELVFKLKEFDKVTAE